MIESMEHGAWCKGRGKEGEGRSTNEFLTGIMCNFIYKLCKRIHKYAIRKGKDLEQRVDGKANKIL